MDKFKLMESKEMIIKEFEIFPTLWNERNPYQVYVISL